MFGAIRDLITQRISIPETGPVLPVLIQLGETQVTLHADGKIEGNYEAAKAHLEKHQVNVFAEDKIIYWLLMQVWRQQLSYAETNPETEWSAGTSMPEYTLTHGPDEVLQFDGPQLVKEYKQAHIIDPLPVAPKPLDLNRNRREKVIMTDKGPVNMKYKHID